MERAWVDQSFGEAGFEEKNIRAEQWGNRAAAARNLEDTWPPSYDPERDDLTNDPECPIGAWALARQEARSLFVHFF